MSGGLGGGMTAEQQLQQRLLRSRLRGSSQQQQHHHHHAGLGGGLLGGPSSLLPQPLLLPQPAAPAPPASSCPLSPPSPPDSPPPGTTPPLELPAGPRPPSATWCSLCRVYCPEPVCLPCGHNFCTGCIGQRLGEPKLNISCLECGATSRKRNLRPFKLTPQPLPCLPQQHQHHHRQQQEHQQQQQQQPATPLLLPPAGGPERLKRQRLEVATPVVGPGPVPVATVTTTTVTTVTPAAAAAATTATASSGSAAAPPPPPPPPPSPLPVATRATRSPTPPPLTPATPPSPAVSTTSTPGGAPDEPPAALVSPTVAAAVSPRGGGGGGAASAAAASAAAPALGGAGDGIGGRLCEKHRDVLQFFCEEDQTPICAQCDRSQEHRAHSVFHVERAARDYRERVLAQLEILKQEKITLWSQKVTGEKKIQEYIEKIQAERQEIVSQFEHLHQFLKDQEQCLLIKLEELDKEIEKQKEEMVSRLSEELSRLGDVITEMEVKCKQPASEFLQDIKKDMNRCAVGQHELSEDRPRLEERLNDFSRKVVALKETLKAFQDNIINAVEKGEIARMLNDKDAAFDPDVSGAVTTLDRRSIGFEESHQRLPALQYVPDTPKRLDSKALVLGCDGFTSGRYFWELEVGDGEFWAVGVTRDPSKKKGMMDFSPEEGIWAVGLWKGQYWALTSPVTALSLSKHPKHIRVSLDYVGESVTFTDADTGDLIFTFPPASFNGARSHPLLWVVGFPAQTVFLRRMGVKYPIAVHEMDVLSP